MDSARYAIFGFHFGPAMLIFDCALTEQILLSVHCYARLTPIYIGTVLRHPLYPPVPRYMPIHAVAPIIRGFDSHFMPDNGRRHARTVMINIAYTSLT
ncbi:hypothetical protein Hypma_008447 [Hypsizygus marmoreus]|uniref:Uncharacterized protein n=1 Tax=Hypsizygus marmoreus TaxID=39966 RepID=A0A369JY27_HYPMA|nr:hypothetical protein Hypma_008447 [Hypsizygus marmoreus]